MVRRQTPRRPERRSRHAHPRCFSCAARPAQLVTTSERTLVKSDLDKRGYHRLVQGPGEHHLQRDAPAEAFDGDEVLATLLHLSDLHVCDAQSPARAEL